VPDPRYRVLIVSSHPIQYASANFQEMARHPRFDLKVVYCSLHGAEPALDPEFGTTVQWDIPLLDGYDWVQVPNRGNNGDSFWALWNPGLWKLIRAGQFDAVLCYLSYRYSSFWISYFASKLTGSVFLFGCDQHSLLSRDGRAWKSWLKKLGWPLLYSLADQVTVSSNPARSLILSLGVPEQDVTLVPLAVDNGWWEAQLGKVDRAASRATWGANSQTSVVLFCAKLQPWKRPMDILRAFAQADLLDAILVYAGEGAQRQELEREATALGVGKRVRFLGFVNQSQLPAVYAAADLMVLPSEYEPFGVVVNEASCCACPVVASDRVGAAIDLIAPVDSGLIYPCGDLRALSTLLSELCRDHGRLRELGWAAKRRMGSWSPHDTVAGTVEAVGAALRRRH
jgi:glycosyltransferase involved in cell wall biosynthesis